MSPNLLEHDENAQTLKPSLLSGNVAHIAGVIKPPSSLGLPSNNTRFEELRSESSSESEDLAAAHVHPDVCEPSAKRPKHSTRRTAGLPAKQSAPVILASRNTKATTSKPDTLEATRSGTKSRTSNAATRKSSKLAAVAAETTAAKPPITDKQG
ncbi:hypothetical protein PHYPSEUDO_015300 [Phytophthora pseudosyringae]|uniref:Uncharacterized protein n=1 Tax=Phytophthora pseudosyringae TaxID=221518 RepID=A0A8T1V6P4_9STRA|nr:hypothetical protein PHYPSEUDO_015300 [Phytophthora pseudosyringae]